MIDAIYQDADRDFWAVIEGKPYLLYKGSYEDHYFESVSDLERGYGPLLKFEMES